MDEIRVPVVGHENKYWISNYGEVKSSKIKLSSATNTQGYPMIALYKNWKHKSYTIHRLMMLSFNIENPYNKRTINHIDWNKSNNNLTNLEWNTHKENILNAMKLWWELKMDVRSIRRRDWVKTNAHRKKIYNKRYQDKLHWRYTPSFT